MKLPFLFFEIKPDGVDNRQGRLCCFKGLMLNNTAGTTFQWTCMHFRFLISPQTEKNF